MKELAYKFAIAELHYRDSCHGELRKDVLDKLIDEKELAFSEFVKLIKGE